ncbi:MAG: hypothetical protein JW798_18110, partial [Prolixibacteraceae bacterium]|nr:hypothetical protein [Prolixibacteraceae bacterium]
TWAQVPGEMSYQSVIRDNSGSIMVNHNIGMQLSILQGSVNGTVVYIERQFPASNENGLVTISIGGIAATVISGSFTNIDWSNGPYFLKTEIDLNGGSNYTLTGTSQLLSVPYAFHANTADNLTYEIIETDPVFIGSPAANITAGHLDGLTNLSGVNTGDQDLSGFISEETDPVFDASIASEITEDDIEGWNKKSISLNVFGAFIAGSAQFWSGFGPNAGLGMPNESNSSFSMNFTLPADYETGSQIVLRMVVSSLLTGGVSLMPNYISIGRADVGFIMGSGASTGLTIDGTINIVTPDVPVVALGYISTPNRFYPLQAGDVISFGFYRSVSNAADTNSGSVLIHGIEVLY